MDEHLGQETKKGLVIADSLDDRERSRFIRAVVNTATKDLTFVEAPECPTAEHNQLQTALLTLYTIAVKHNISSEDLRKFLSKGLGIKDESVADLIEGYDHSKEDIKWKLSRYGSSTPWASHVNWKLSSVLRSSGREELNADLVYKVNFEGIGPNNGRSVVTSFECTLEELQNLSSKFKEIERSCHRIAENK